MECRHLNKEQTKALERLKELDKEQPRAYWWVWSIAEPGALPSKRKSIRMNLYSLERRLLVERIGDDDEATRIPGKEPRWRIRKGKPPVNLVDLGQCQATISVRNTAAMKQCTRSNGYGRNNRYCKRHAEKA